MLTRIALGLALTAVLAVPPSAKGAVQLTIRDGRVWLTADRATIAEILAEWSRVGTTRMVNTERLGGPFLTLDLRGVPELDALDVILRSAGGFVAVSRTADTDAFHLSRFSQVVIVPSAGTGAPAPSLVPVPVPPVVVQAPVFTEGGARRLIGPDGQVVPDDQEDAPPPPRPAPPATVVPGGSMPPGFSEPPGAGTPGGVPRPGLVPPVIPPRRPGGTTSQ